MGARRRNQRGQDATEIVVHIARVPKCRCRSTHDRANKLVSLTIARILQMKPVTCNPAESCIVQDDDAVGIVDQPFECQHRIIGLHNDI